MSRRHVAPRVIETEIELFLDNFKYVTSLLHNEFSVLDCRTTLDNDDAVITSPNDNNRLSWPDDPPPTLTAGQCQGHASLSPLSKSQGRSALTDFTLGSNSLKVTSWPDDTESVSGPRHSVTTSSDVTRRPVTPIATA